MNFQTPEEMNMTFLLFISMLLAAIFISCSSHAYVPNSNFVFNRLTSQHGRGSYIMEDEVTFHEGTETTTIKETWIVVDGSEMRLSASGDGLRLFKITKKGRHFWVDENGAERSVEVPQDNIMKILNMRTANEEKRVFVNWRVLPPDVFREKKLPKEAKDIHVETEPFVRLGRVGGTVAFAYGTPSASDSSPNPGVWIEQDQFNIRKIRTPDLSEAYFNDYGTYSKGLVFPKNQTIIFDNHTVNVRVNRIVSSELSNDMKRQFDVNLLRSRSDVRAQWPPSTTSVGPVIQEFYKRFR